jgi:HrpA-like RNA helicase
MYEILPLHGKLTPDEQQRIFQNSRNNKIILSTRIAETAITIANIGVVIDVGYDREQVYDQTKRMNVTEVNEISKSQAKQRAGRAGRTKEGVCYRIYSTTAYQEFPDHKKPEIQRSNLDHVILKLKKFKVDKVSDFDFIESPEKSVLDDGVETLKMLGGLDENERITNLGKIMAEMPTEPITSRILYESVHRQVPMEVAKIIAVMQNCQNLFFRGNDDRQKESSDLSKAGFMDETGDFLTFLRVYEKFERVGGPNHRGLHDWGRRNHLNIKALKEAHNLFKELTEALKKLIALKEMEDNEKELLILANKAKAELQKELIEIEEKEDDLSETTSTASTNQNEERHKKGEDFEEELEADFDFYNEDLRIPIEIKCNQKTENIIKSFLVGFFTNLCYYSGNPNLGYTLLRDSRNIKIYGSSSLALQGKLNYKWLICTDIQKKDNMTTKIANAVDINWIQECIDIEYRRRFKLAELEKTPVY